MIKLWDDLREVYDPGETKLDAAKVRSFSKYMESYFHPEVCGKLYAASVEGAIGMDNEKKDGDYRGTYPKRVQQWLLKNYDIQLSDKSNVINDLLGKVNKNQIPSKLYARFAKKIDWSAGNFGDNSSCYWGGNAITRYFLTNWNCFRAMLFYTRLEKCGRAEFDRTYGTSKQYYWQDGWAYKGYGRCLTAIDFPSPGMFLMWNAYPNGELVNQYLSGLFTGLGKDDPELVKKLKSKTVSFTNGGSGGGWFYTNGRNCQLVGLPDQINKVGTNIDLGYVGTPDKTKLNEYVCECSHCGKRGVWSDRPSIDGVICEHCITNHQVTCFISGKKGFGPSKDHFDVMNLESVFKLVTEKSSGRNNWVSPEEFAKLDTSKYDTPWMKLQTAKKDAVLAMVAAMPDMEDDLDEEYEDDDEEYDDD